jgi:ADP-ribose pyrophosphatase YjhB (NUDIX family)
VSGRAPGVGVGAAIIAHGRILLIRRARPPEAGCWGLPGGKVEPFEPLQTAVGREIEEEIGVELGPLGLLCVVDQIAPDGSSHWVAPVYLATEIVGEPRIREPEKHLGLGWFDLDALPEPVTAATTEAVAAFRMSYSAASRKGTGEGR